MKDGEVFVVRYLGISAVSRFASHFDKLIQVLT